VVTIATLHLHEWFRSARADFRRRRQPRSGPSPGDDDRRGPDLMAQWDDSAPPQPGGDAGTGGGTPGSGRVANEAGLQALGSQMRQATSGRRAPRHAAKKGGKNRGRHRLRRGLIIGLCVVLVLVAGGAGYTYYLTHDLKRVQVRGLTGALTTGKEAGTENILMVGSTSRCALTVQNPAYGLCSEGVNGVNSDVIMILHADPTTHQIALLSIPRDLFIPNARSTGANKIDAGLFEGLTQLVSAIEEDFGIPIQHTVSLNFDQFSNVVDALGGINMAFPISVFDAESGLNVQAATCVHLNGTQALEVVRARHLQYQQPGEGSYAVNWTQENLSDLARIRRDHEFLRVLAGAVAKQGLGNPVADISLINSVKADLTFDQNWPVGDMANLVLAFHSADINSVPQLTLPVAVVIDPDGAGGSLQYQGGSYGDVEFPSQSQDQSAVDTALGVGPDTDTMTGAPLPAAASVNVSVVNGTGAYNQATDTATSLSALGFHTVGVGDAAPVGDVAETVVYYGSRSAPVEAAAEKVADSMTGSVIMGFDPTMVTDGAQVTVVTGSQFAVDAPAATRAPTDTGQLSTPTSTTVPATTTTSTTSPATAAIAAPSPTVSDLEPWDPRACPAGATPTAPVANQVG
jgi:LCP family protein required for cell wall assembly